MLGAMKRKASEGSVGDIIQQTLVNNSNNRGGYNGGQSQTINGNNGGIKPEKRIRWDGPRTQSLIEHYRSHEFLWNPKLADYKNDKKRTRCLEKWLESCQLERDLVNEVKMKLHGLRTSFGHQLKLECAGPGTGEGLGEKGREVEPHSFTSKWQWYNHLSFLKDTMTFRNSPNNPSNSPRDSPPPMAHQILTSEQVQLIHLSQQSNNTNLSFHDDDSDSNMKIEPPSDTPLNMQVSTHYGTIQNADSHSSEYELRDTPQHHRHFQQPHNLSVSGVVPISVQIHDPLSHQSVLVHSRKDEDESIYHHHHNRINASPPMAHMQSITSLSQQNQQPSVAHNHSQSGLLELMPRFQNSCCGSCNLDRIVPRPTVGEKLGRLVEETMNNLHPDYQEMAKNEIQQILGKYLQKPLP